KSSSWGRTFVLGVAPSGAVKCPEPGAPLGSSNGEIRSTEGCANDSSVSHGDGSRVGSRGAHGGRTNACAARVGGGGPAGVYRLSRGKARKNSQNHGCGPSRALRDKVRRRRASPDSSS